MRAFGAGVAQFPISVQGIDIVFVCFCTSLNLVISSAPIAPTPRCIPVLICSVFFCDKPLRCNLSEPDGWPGVPVGERRSKMKHFVSQRAVCFKEGRHLTRSMMKRCFIQLKCCV